MTPGARLAAAIAVLDLFLRDERALIDPLLRDWARGARYAGSKDRAGVADLVYGALRRLQSARLGAEPRDGRAAALGALRLEGRAVEEIGGLADGGPHRPTPLSAEERGWLEALPQRAIEHPLADFPRWLLPLLEASVAAPAAEIAALARRGALDFRVNALKSAVAAAAGALADDDVATSPGPYAPTALRAVGLGAAARPKLSGLEAYRAGLVEPQDAASQAVALLAAEFVGGEGRALDVCAGGGGKTLALAAAAPAARLCAFDVEPKRMRDLPARLSRAGAAAEILDRDGLAALAGRADMALVDAPCSGSGAWARQPDAKWRLTPERLKKLQSLQAEALDLGAATVRPGGALVYATCSLLTEENDDSLTRFLARNGAFEPVDLGEVWSAAGLCDRPPKREKSAFDASTVLFPPSHRGADGFYVAALRRRGGR